MIIREARSGDADGIATVHVKSWQETYRGIMPDEVLDNLSLERRQTWWQDIIANQLEEHPLFVAEIDGDIVAFASGGAVRGDYDYDSELYTLYALKSVHGQGIGRKLMERLAEELYENGYRSMMLWVAKNNPTEGFYAHMGGKPFTEKTESFADSEIVEVAYGWADIQTLFSNKGES